jgi:cobalt-zinc-cadmium efflux system protein
MHAHAHGGTADTRRILRISLAVTALYILLLVIAGVRANSLALLSEAGHNISDLLALLLSLVAVYIQSRPPSAQKTFGYHRAGVLAAFVNAGSLVLIAFYIFYEAFRRVQHPEPVQSGIMMAVAAAGVVMNGGIAWLLYRGSSNDVNVRSVLVHELGDTLATFAVILGGYAIRLTGQNWIDAALSVGIGALILWSSFGILRETLNILLEGTPHGMDADKIVSELEGVDGVLGVHDLHVWSIGSDTHALSAHIMIADIPLSASEKIMHDVRDALADRFHIHHSTIQFEREVCEVAHGCNIPVSHAHDHHGHSH